MINLVYVTKLILLLFPMWKFIVTCRCIYRVFANVCWRHVTINCVLTVWAPHCQWTWCRWAAAARRLFCKYKTKYCFWERGVTDLNIILHMTDSTWLSWVIPWISSCTFKREVTSVLGEHSDLFNLLVLIIVSPFISLSPYFAWISYF